MIIKFEIDNFFNELKNGVTIDFIHFDIKRIMLPIIIKYDHEYYFSLKEELRNYRNYIESLGIFPINLQDTIRKNSELVIKSIEYYYNAQFDRARKCILEIINNYINNEFIVSDIYNSYIFHKCDFGRMSDETNDIYPVGLFRARESVEQISKHNMLHIPLSKREVVSMQRFGMLGVPCIYTATSTYCCWLELNMPAQDTFYASLIRFPEDIKVFNLAISSNLICNSNVCVDGKGLKLLESILSLWPLICATSYNILEKNRNFKSEYVISQLVMQCLQDLNIDAVAYCSKKISDFRAYPYMVNLAIPVKKDFEKNNEYWIKANKVFLNNPMCFKEFVDKTRQFDFHEGLGINLSFEREEKLKNIEFIGKDMNYKALNFSDFDNYLLRMRYESFF